jgi:hypothetical protein
MTIADSSMVAVTTTALAEVTAEVIGDKGGYSAIDAANKALKGAARANSSDKGMTEQGLPR